MNTVDAPKEEVADENIKKNYKIIKNNCKMKLIVKADTLKITKQRFTHTYRSRIFGYDKALYAKRLSMQKLNMLHDS